IGRVLENTAVRRDRALSGLEIPLPLGGSLAFHLFFPFATGRPLAGTALPQTMPRPAPRIPPPSRSTKPARRGLAACGPFYYMCYRGSSSGTERPRRDVRRTAPSAW